MDYSNVRPQSGTGGMAPAEFSNRPRQRHMDTEAKLLSIWTEMDV